MIHDAAESGDSLNRKAFKAGTAFVIVQLIVKGISFLAAPIYTRMLSVSQYGQVRVYESWLLICVPLMSLSLYRSAEKAKYDFKDSYEEYISSVLLLACLFIAGFFIMISLLFRDAFFRAADLNTVLYLILVGCTFSHTAILLFHQREKQLMRYRASITLSAFTMIPATLVSIVLIYVGIRLGKQDYSVELRNIGFFVPQIIGGMVAATMIFIQGKGGINLRYWRYALVFSIPLIPQMLSVQIINQSDKIMIQELVTEEKAGIYSLATTVSYIIWILEDSVWSAWLPWLYEKITRKEIRDIEKPWMRLVAVFGLLSWLLSVFAPELILILGGAKYRDAAFLVAPLVTGVLFRLFSYAYSAEQNYYNKTKWVGLCTTIAMFINIGLNYAFILLLGYQAAAYTTVISYFTLMVMQGVVEKRITGERIVPLGKMIAAAAVIFILNEVTMVLFWLTPWVRYLIAAIVCAVLFTKYSPKKEVIEKFLKGDNKFL